MAYKIFFCYAHEDEVLLRKLMAHLKPLQLDGLVDQIWHDRDINPGSEWEPELVRELNAANIILLLISSAFMASDYCYTKELHQAIERHELKEARVIPIILSPVYWQVNPLYKLQALPKDGKAITGSGWHSMDEAMENVVKGIRNAIKDMQKKQVNQYSTLRRYIAEQVNQGKSIIEALKYFDPNLLNLFTTFVEEYIRQDESVATYLQAQIEKLVSEISGVAEEDLRIKAEVTADAIGVIADSFNYLVAVLADVIIRIQKTTTQEITISNQVLSTLAQERKIIGDIAEVVGATNPTIRESLKNPLFDLYKAMGAMKEDVEHISDLSNKLYASVSHFLLPPEESIDYVGKKV